MCALSLASIKSTAAMRVTAATARRKPSSPSQGLSRDRTFGEADSQNRFGGQALAQASHLFGRQSFVVEQHAQQIGGGFLHPFAFELVGRLAHAACPACHDGAR